MYVCASFINQIKKYNQMKIKVFLLAMVLLLLCNYTYTQTDTRGTDFWLTFGKNFHNNYDNDSLNLQIRIISAREAAKGEIYFTGLGTSVSFSLAANQVYTCSLDKTQKQAVYNSIMGKSNFSIHITTSAPVAVYALNQARCTTDATNVLPVSALGVDYYQISYRTSDVGLSDAYSVIATEDNTEISHNDSVVATLNRGEVYYRTASTDMTGAHITATKPVAFFAMCNGTDIPLWQIAGDCLFQQLAPVNTWGKKFLVPVCRTPQNREIVRVVASQDSTTITQKGGTVRTGSLALHAGQYVEIDVTGTGCYITADKPIGVCSFFTGGGETLDAKSDPAQAWLPPLEQTLNSALITSLIPESITRLDRYYALVLTPTATKRNTRVKTGNGAPQALRDEAWIDNVVAGMSFYSMPITDDSLAYLYSNPAGLIVMTYAHGSYESYYCHASLFTRNVEMTFYVNDIAEQDLVSEIFCDSLLFRVEITGDISTEEGYLKWYVDEEEEITARDQVSWKKNFAEGVYQIRVEVQMDDGITIKTVETVITVKQPVLDSIANITLCNDEICPMISFSGDHVNTCTWEIMEGPGIEAGMIANSGTGLIPAFTALNTETDDISVTIIVTPQSRSGCTGEPKIFTITVNPCNGNSVPENDSHISANISVYPNPTTGQLQIRNYELSMGEIGIYDVVGRKQKAESKFPPFGGVGVVDISHLPAGIYFLRAGTETVKVVKE
jgi:hypothetical protein